MRVNCNMCAWIEVMTSVYNSRLKHPFTCIVTGPSEYGKLMFMRKLLLSQEEFTTAVFDYIIIFLGTDASENKTLSSLESVLTQRVYVLEMKNIYHTQDDLQKKFPQDLKNMLKLRSDKGMKGCLIFDDLMEELSHCGVLMMISWKSCHIVEFSLSCSPSTLLIMMLV